MEGHDSHDMNTSRLNIRITDDQYLKIRTYAELKGITMSQVIRELIEVLRV